MTGDPVRLAHLHFAPVHYQAPLYRELETRPEIDLTVYFYSDGPVRGYYDEQFGRHVEWDAPLLEGYRSRFLPSASRRKIPTSFWAPPSWDLLGEVLTNGYDAIWVHGYSHPNAWLAAAGARMRGLRLLIREEQTLLHGRPAHKAAIKQLALPALFSDATGLYIGEENRRYLQHYGIPEERLFPAPYCVDNAFFREQAASLAPRREEIRASFGIEGDLPVILDVAKLIPKKAPSVLIEAFERVRAGRPCALLMVGDGELQPALLELAGRRGIPDVHFAGFLNQSELPEAYVAADVFCLPSVQDETWGIVVNEALNFGLPVVVTDKVGSAADLVRPGWNGFVVPAGEVEPLAEALDLLVAQPALRRQLGDHGRALVGEYSVEACADGIVAACLA